MMISFRHAFYSVVTLMLLSFSTYAIDIDVNISQEFNVDFPIKRVVVGSPEVADFRMGEDNSIYIFGKKEGDTNISITGVKGQRKILKIRVNDLRNSATAINTLLVSSGYKYVRAIDMGKNLLVSGSVEDNDTLDEIKELLDQYVDPEKIHYSVDIQKNQQIKIRVTVAEVSKTVTDDLGIDWGQIKNNDSGGGGGSSVGGVDGGNLTVNGGIYTGLVKGFGFDSLGVAINALAKNNLANVLTTPSLTVTNGKSASFHGGGEIPIFQQNQNGSNVEWKDYGVLLNFTPVINADSSISMDVSVESSQIAGYYRYENTELPTIKTREVKTSVKMKDGETFVLAGLIDNNQTQSVNKIPGLADIPVLGALFKSAGFQTGRSELVIFATVEYVQPSQGENIRLPYVKFSSPWEVFFNLKQDMSEVTHDVIKEADYVIE